MSELKRPVCYSVATLRLLLRVVLGIVVAMSVLGCDSELTSQREAKRKAETALAQPDVPHSIRSYFETMDYHLQVRVLVEPNISEAELVRIAKHFSRLRPAHEQSYSNRVLFGFWSAEQFVFDGLSGPAVDFNTEAWGKDVWTVQYWRHDDWWSRIDTLSDGFVAAVFVDEGEVVQLRRKADK